MKRYGHGFMFRRPSLNSLSGKKDTLVISLVQRLNRIRIQVRGGYNKDKDQLLLINNHHHHQEGEEQCHNNNHSSSNNHIIIQSEEDIIESWIKLWNNNLIMTEPSAGAISSGGEGMVRWDLSNVKLLQSLELAKGDVNSVVFGRNLVLASGSGDKCIEICKWKKGEGFARVEFSPLKEHKYTVSCLDFSPYGTILATASVDGTTILWDASNGEKLTSFIQPGNSAVRVCQFSSKSTLLLTAGDCGGVHIWDVSTKTHKRTLQGHEEAVYAASFAPDEKYLVSGCSGGLMHLWECEDPSVSKPVATVEAAHDLGITCLAFASNVIADGASGRLCLMVSGGNDHFIKLWNVYLGNAKSKSSLQLLRILQGHSESVMCVRISSVCGLIASTSGDKTTRLWELSGKCVKVLEGHNRFVTSCGFSTDGKLLATGSNDKRVIIWDLTGTINLEEELVPSQGVEFSLSTDEMWPQYEKLCRSRMLHEENGVTLKASFQVPKVDFNSCVFVGSNVVVGAASSSKCVYGWKLDTNEEIDITSICSHKYAVNSISYSPQLNLLASASTDGTINLFNTEGKKGSVYHAGGAALRVCKFSLDGTLLIAGGDDDKASLWKTSSMSLLGTFGEHEAAIYGCGFTPDAQFVVTGCVNGYLKLWDCAVVDENGSNASLQTQENAHELGVTSCDFSPIGLSGSHGHRRYLLGTGGNDSTVKVWCVDVRRNKMATFTLLHNLTDHGTANIMCVAFAPSGKMLASAAGDKTIRLWDADSGACLQVVEGHQRYVTSCTFAVGLPLMATCSSDHTVKVWHLQGTLAYSTATIEHEAVESLIATWSCEDVVNWLAEIGLGDLGHIFESHEISGDKLATITDKMLQVDFGIEEENLRNNILTEIKWLKSLGVGSAKSRASKGTTISAPIEFFCPITHDIMIEPVTTCDGHTYERAAITEWFLTGKTTSPLTNMEVESMALTPNFELQNRISEFLAQRLSAEGSS